jgi:hypothetical protein
MRRTVTALSTAAAIFGVVAITTPVRADGGVEQFNGRVAAYMALHERLEQSTQPLRITSDARDIFEAVQAMASAVRAARPNAKAGDIFTPEVAVEFRRRLGDGLHASGFNAEAVLARILEDNTEDTQEASLTPAINEPLGCGLAMTPPFVFSVLPALPSELQYRFVGRHLVLYDAHAKLVIDVLSDALPDH